MEEERMAEALVGAILVVFILIAILVTLGVVNSGENYKERESYSSYKTVVTEYTTHTGASYSNEKAYPHQPCLTYEGSIERNYDITKHVTVIEGERYSLETLRR